MDEVPEWRSSLPPPTRYTRFAALWSHSFDVFIRNVNDIALINDQPVLLSNINKKKRIKQKQTNDSYYRLTCANLELKLFENETVSK